LFAFDPEAQRVAYRRDGWVHVAGGATPAFHSAVCEQLGRRAAQRVERPGVSVAKDQFLFELSDPGLLDELFDTVHRICGLRRDVCTLSERHLNVYASDASPSPRPHKDRYASQVSVGISIVVPRGSHLVLWPDAARGENPLQRAGLTEELHPDHAPEVVLAGTDPIVIEDAPGDVMIFPGSDIWHTRRNPAGAVVLYFKCNEFGSDPLAEDPRTPLVERRSCELAAGVGSNGTVAMRGRRFESVTREYSLGTMTDWLNVHVNGQRAQRITAEELALLVRLDHPTPVHELAHGSASTHRSLCRLASIGAVTLFERDP
jgi:hypothetical protein